VNDNVPGGGGGGGQPITDCNNNGTDDAAELCPPTTSRPVVQPDRFPTEPRMDAQATRSGAYRVLWWDSTPEYGGQASDARRQEMSDYLTDFAGGSVFNSTYVSSETPGTFAMHMATNSYDVIVFDATSATPKFNADDLAAVRTHYQSHSNLLLEGLLYIRNVVWDATTEQRLDRRVHRQ
jgi:hypothetical protein